MTLQTTVRQIKPDTAIISFCGSLTMGMGLNVVDAQIQQLIEKDLRWMVFDLSQVSYMDGAGLGTLMHTHGLVKQRDGKLRLCCVTDRVSALLKLKGMDAILPIDANATASLAALRPDSPA